MTYQTSATNQQNAWGCSQRAKSFACVSAAVVGILALLALPVVSCTFAFKDSDDPACTGTACQTCAGSILSYLAIFLVFLGCKACGNRPDPDMGR